MCGLTGFYSPSKAIARQGIALRMVNRISHRGPNDSGVWADGSSGLTLAHRRLSILDPTPAGHQPMHSSCERYVVAFNGEIYNHLQLRIELHEQGVAPVWRSHTDTETLLACFVAWGIEKTLKATAGMFAIALWDRKERVLTLARDRLGEKPLYWGWQNDTLLFGSELKALKAHPACEAKVNRNALALLLRHGYIPAPHSIYQGIEKLKPGHYINIPLANDSGSPNASQTAYWKFNDVVGQGLANPFTGSDAEAIIALDGQLSSSVADQMLADVPLGAFLSGGVDSSTIVALMQAHSSTPIRTFTMGFSDPRYDEAIHAQRIAKHLGTEHTELYIQPDDAAAIIPLLPSVYCEPFADSSQIPTFLVSQLARQHVTVALSGDAGDELFGGYSTYQFAPNIWNKIKSVPLALRQAAALSLGRMPIPHQARKLVDVLDSKNFEDFYRQLVSHWKQPEKIVIGAWEPTTRLNNPAAWPETDNFEHWMMAMEAQMFMTDDILVKVDRASMANSLEVRVPMLDHRVVELAWRMPLDLKIRAGKGKWLLREVLAKYVPNEIMARPKKGFSIPLANWLRGPLREWAEALLNERRLREDGYFHPAPIRRLWSDHLANKRDCSSQLWIVLMFQAWLEYQGTSE
ncbi:asparagine synthase (glutamine-hydrolyzing) [Alcaligenaceae bacterium]|nr:asparagine synthase (glutamine-hydrolyzing) [Alcaligenaceae bacterium]